MNSTGIVRTLDDLGRVCLPKEYRKTLEIEPNEEIDIKIENNKITIEKFSQSCSLCGESKNEFKMVFDKKICVSCLEKLQDLAVRIK